MKKCMIYVLLSLIGVPTIQAQMLTYEEIVKKITVYMPEMNIKDSVFLQEIDSKIFNSGCACLDYEEIEKARRWKLLSHILDILLSRSQGWNGIFRIQRFPFCVAWGPSSLSI